MVSSSPIKKLAIRGAIWTFVGYGAGQVLRLGSNLILSRLLFPELFGLMGLVYVFITGLSLFSDLGISTSVIRYPKGDDPEFLNTAWTLQVMRGVGLWLACLLVAIPAAQFYQEPRLRWLIPLVGFSSILAGFNSTALFTLNRHLSIKTLAIFEFSAQLISTIVMIGWAIVYPSIWALMVGGLTSTLFQLIWSHKLNHPLKNRFVWNRDAVKELVSFGKWIFVSTAFTFLATQSDRLILADLFSLELFGVYIIAFTLSDVPHQVLLAISNKVIFPSYSKLIDLPRNDLRIKILRNRRPILLVVALGLALLITFGDQVIIFLYDSRYYEAAWMLPILALGTWPIALTQTIDPMLFALGRPRVIALACFLSFLCFILGIPLGYYWLGPPGAISAVAVSNIPPWMVITFALRQERLSPLKQDLLITTIFLLFLGSLILTRSTLGLGSFLDYLPR